MFFLRALSSPYPYFLKEVENNFRLMSGATASVVTEVNLYRILWARFLAYPRTLIFYIYVMLTQ